ncbi:ribonucleases P/MRP protein subunit POP1-domain-containing protein [Pisolithus orientalis]|uniref:ribonucleases P/MRP protein subunit POP1-domain-containing protein n=1 Tax=Pisolithus orientalis TaxID=936130 RepID=UPI0022256F14|nr:ribonucleases P/MRP protein subunit POP1-domain-containing protein [Pisolithus orientalis]KAI5991699.1 ribonucleases P/MRP protein subunit POP1-domain-containing protein [Pisolithus orientalis]
MPPKRKGDEVDELNARERKKLKVADARTIAVQPVASGSSSGQGDHATNARPGPSKININFDSMKGLPATLDVERFTEARAYEIDAMEKAIKSAKDSSTHRAWQTLPRHLRRRAASHNVRRVPLRLREKARAEMDPVKHKAHSGARPKRGKAKQMTRTESLLKRQCDKAWLETHIWHAKRTKMENMWGYRLSVTPTEKAFRPSHRASVHGSILHDASYYGTIELKGPQSVLLTALETCCDPQGSGLKQCTSGSRTCDTHMYEHARWPFGLIGPVTIIWQPLALDSTASETQTETKSSRKGKGKGKQKETNDNAASDPSPHARVLWVRAHPAVFEDVFEAVNKSNNPTVSFQVEMNDLRGVINAFEVMGPKSSQIIKGALSLAGDDEREDFNKFWKSLSDLQTPGNVPRRMIIGLKVVDPRLKFPPENPKPSYPDISKSSAAPASGLVFPTSSTAQSDIWDENQRDRLKKPKYKKKDLDERRSKLAIPGTKLRALRQDDRIPVMLVQRSLEAYPPSSPSPSTLDKAQGIHGWTLLFPAGWSMAFLPSLIYTGTRVAGQRERTKQYFEAGIAAFPVDYPTTRACEVASEERAIQERERWERTPPAKRTNWEKLGTRESMPLPPEVGTAEGLVNTQREDLSAAEEVRPVLAKTSVRPWLLRGPKVPSILSDVSLDPPEFLERINKLRERHHMVPLDRDVDAAQLWQTALVMVRIKMVGRGVPSDLAGIYKMDDIEARKWLAAIRQSTSVGTDDAETQTEDGLGDIRPAQEDIIGYVTTGDASLSRGEGFALGAISVVQYLTLRRQAQRLAQPAVIVKFRNRDSTVSRAAYLELLDA